MENEKKLPEKKLLQARADVKQCLDFFRFSELEISVFPRHWAHFGGDPKIKTNDILLLV